MSSRLSTLCLASQWRVPLLVMQSFSLSVCSAVCFDPTDSDCALLHWRCRVGRGLVLPPSGKPSALRVCGFHRKITCKLPLVSVCLSVRVGSVDEVRRAPGAWPCPRSRLCLAPWQVAWCPAEEGVVDRKLPGPRAVPSTSVLQRGGQSPRLRFPRL